MAVDTTWEETTLPEDGPLPEDPTLAEGDTTGPPPPPLTAGRYRTLRPLGRGGQGQVELAEDLLTGDRVAVKRLRVPTARAAEQARREVTTLRWLRLPGVVRLHDEGLEGDTWYLVMDHVPWGPFPDATAGWGWERLRHPLLGLLRALVPVHDLGIVHADIKPGNVLVGPEGEVCLLDFGIATGRGLPPGGNEIQGTHGYIAPERLARRPIDARADLYAVGRMALRALGGRAPPAVQAVLESMVAPDPELRPPSARAALEALGDEPATFSGAPTEAALRELFLGPEPFLHLPSDAARVLWARSGGAPEAVAAELDAWQRAGLAVQEPGGVRVGRLALERLERRPEEARLEELLTAGAAAAELAAEALRVARWWKRDGRPRRAMAVVDRVLGPVRAQAPHLELPLLTLRSAVALALESVEATDEALVELGRSPRRGPEHERQEALLRAARAALAGAHAHASELARALPPQQDEDLEGWRVALLTRAAQRAGTTEETLRALEDWASTPARRARWLGFWGNLRYTQGRYAEAAALYLEAVPGRADRDTRLSAQRNAATALLEQPDLPRARDLAALVAAEARLCGNEKLEAYATRVLRVADYRLGTPLQPEPALVDAAEHIDPSVVGMFGLCEAAIAWRAGLPELACALASRGARGFRAAGRKDPALLCQAIPAACGALPEPALRALAQDALACRLPEFRMEILALVHSASAAPDPTWAAEVRACAALLDPARRRVRLDLISSEEALARVGHVG